MDKKPLFAVGDIVRVKELDELKREFGNTPSGIRTPCHFVRNMFKYCGREFEVAEAHVSCTGLHCFYILGDETWNFDECVLEYVSARETAIKSDAVSITYNDLF